MKDLNKYEVIYNGQNELIIEKYYDFDWAKDKKSWKLIYDFIFIFNRGLINWYSKRQPIITHLSSKTMYISLILVAKKPLGYNFYL